MTRQDRKIPWILSYNQRKLTSRKFRKTEEEIQKAKDEKRWTDCIRLKSLLRRAWWGIKRYKDK